MSRGGPPLPRGPVQRLRRIVESPRMLVRRARMADLDPAGRALLEHFRHRDQIYQLLADTAENPDLIHDFAVDDDDVIFDVGGYRGEWCLAMAARTSAPIHVFEPAPAALQHLERAVSGQPSLSVHPYGLAASSGRVTLSEQGPGSSTHDEGSGSSMTVVQLRGIDEVLGELGVDEVTLMKVNIEGGEYELFEYLLRSGDIRRFDELLIQFHDWLPAAHRRRRKIRAGLQESHELVWDYPFIWERWRARR